MANPVREAFSKALNLALNLEFRRLWASAVYKLGPAFFRGWRRLFGRDLSLPVEPGVSCDPVMIYQMAKVGSTSVWISLRVAYLKRGLYRVPLHHVHTLRDLEGQAEGMRRLGDTEQLQTLCEYLALRETFDQDTGGHWRVISLVRDPVARKVSYFFHTLERHLPGWRQRWQAGALPIQEVMDAFLALEDDAHEWFDLEVKAVLGIDVYETPFSAGQGYQIYRHPPKVDLLVLRLEDLPRVVGEALHSFLGLRDFVLYPANLGQERGYAEVYRAFKALPLPASFVQQAYSTRFARHFYTDAELGAFARRWTHAGR
jgi:hypothetical protein